MGGDPGLEPLANQTRPGFRRSELVGVFQVVEKCQMHRAGFVERSQPPDLLAAARWIDQTRLRQRGDIGQRRGRWSLKKSRLRHSTRRGPAGYKSERCPAAKLELLHPVELTLGKRHCIVKAQWTERRRPDQADTHRRADDIAAVVLQSQARTRRYGISRWRSTAGRVDLAGGDPGSRPLVIVQCTRIGINGALQPNFLRQEPERHLQLRRGTPILGAAKRVPRPEGIDVARTDAVGGKAADKVRPHLEMIKHANTVAAKPVQNAALNVDQPDNIGNQRGVVFGVDRTLQIGHVTADSGEVLPEVNQQAVGRVLVVVERIVIQRIAQRRRQRLAALEFLADRQRCLAVAIAPEAHTRSVGRGSRKVSSSTYRVYKRRGRVEGEERVSRIIVTICQIARQRDLLLIDRIANLQGKVFAQGEAEPRAETDCLGAVRNITISELLAIERVKAKRDTVIQQIRLDK